ncbi:MAG TPA: hypothetical protein VEU62_19955 [Bryobacterales bacterium]|nr:hypothetical protein [Bryobacterales bacterium]
MRRRLLWLDLALVALAAAGLWRLRVDYHGALARYRMLSAAAAAAPALKNPPVERPGLPGIQPGSYLDAAQGFLFSPDRNPNVVVEPVKVKPRPTLPLLYGVLDLNGNPIAIMAEKQDTPHKTVHVGDTIGEFKLVAAAGENITLEWEGQTIQAKVSDVLVKQPGPGTPGGPANVSQSPGGPAPERTGPRVTNSSNTSQPGPYVIGQAMESRSGTIYASPPGDTAPNGAVYEGKRKVVRQTPFGNQSWWEDIKQ